jgi:hypothetical protein
VYKQVLLDLDGPLVNFIDGVRQLHPQFTTPYRDIRWGFDEEVFPGDRERFWGPMGFDFWADLPKTKFCDPIVDKAVELVGLENVAICTSPTQTRGSIEGKIEWAKRNLPHLMKNRQFVVTPRKQFAAGPYRILVDDRDENIDDFKYAGGHGILFPAPWNKNRYYSEDDCTALNYTLLELTNWVLG